MTDDAFEFAEESVLRDVKYRLYEPLWRLYDLTIIDLSFENWRTIKFLNEDGTAFSDEINTLPNDRGGLYLFFVKCPIITGITEYPLYIGRAQYTANQNLRKRIREYFLQHAKEDERPRIKKMIRYWGAQLYVSFKEIDDNSNTIEFEKRLINSLLLPFNTQIPDSELGETIQAFPL